MVTTRLIEAGLGLLAFIAAANAALKDPLSDVVYACRPLPATTAN